jgi:hypothetical protein
MPMLPLNNFWENRGTFCWQLTVALYSNFGRLENGQMSALGPLQMPGSPASVSAI